MTIIGVIRTSVTDRNNSFKKLVEIIYENIVLSESGHSFSLAVDFIYHLIDTK